MRKASDKGFYIVPAGRMCYNVFSEEMLGQREARCGMPFEIVRNDIVNMRADAIVNTANPRPLIGWGVDAGIHKKAGRELLKARREIGCLKVGEAAVTPGFGLDAKIVIHTVGPVWRDGLHGEEEALSMCYRASLEAALANQCESVAFPLISAGNHGFPKPLALKIAVREISGFLMENDMKVYLAVFSRDAFRLSEKLFSSVASYIDDNYAAEKTYAEYGVEDKCSVRSAQINAIETALSARRREEILRAEKAGAEMCGCICAEQASLAGFEWERLFSQIDAGFSETLLKLIDASGRKDSEIYRKANVDRKLFSKIRNNPAYKPSKATALSFAIALELNLKETQDFIARAGYTLTHSSKFDVIVEYFIVNGIYDIHEMNTVLFEHDQPLLCV